jgi:hypothetical protein
MDIILHKNIFDEMTLNIRQINNIDRISKNLNANLTRKYIFYLNPVGGLGKSLQIWNSIQPILSKLLTLN